MGKREKFHFTRPTPPPSKPKVPTTGNEEAKAVSKIALVSNSGQEDNEQNSLLEEYVTVLPINEIGPSPHQTRKNISIENYDIITLAENIKKVGRLIQKIVVRPNPDSNGQYKWLLIGGERRLTACKRLGMQTVKVEVINNIKDEKEAWALTFTENFHRKQLNTEENGEAIEYAREEFGMTQSEVADSLGVSQGRVSQIEGEKKIPEDLKAQLKNIGKYKTRYLLAFGKLIGRVRLTTYVAEPSDTLDIKKIKLNIDTLLNELINENLNGEEAIARTKELLNPGKIKSFMSAPYRNLMYLIRNRPSKMSIPKRQMTLEQTEELIDALQRMYQEEKEKMDKAKQRDLNNQKTPVAP